MQDLGMEICFRVHNEGQVEKEKSKEVETEKKENEG